MDRDARISQSWLDNADAWVSAVREGQIPSRRAGTDAAIVEAVMAESPARVLDAGCGEGWLARALAGRGLEVTGFDGSAELIRRARELGGAVFLEVGYRDLMAAPASVGHDFDVVVFNFSLFAEDIVPILAAARRTLRAGGRLLIQTVHPFHDACDAPYVDGWREESFATMSDAFRTPMPWYFRTLQTWLHSVSSAGYQIAGIREPVNSETGRPLSLIIRGLRLAI